MDLMSKYSEKYFLFFLPLILLPLSGAPGREFTLNASGSVVLKGQVLGQEIKVPSDSSDTFVFSADKYELKNENGQIKVSAFSAKESTPSAQGFELNRGSESLKISTAGEGFSLTDNDISAKTEFPLAIDRASGALSLITPDGEKILRYTPAQVADRLIKEGVMTAVQVSRKEVLEASSSASVSAAPSFKFLDSLMSINNTPDGNAVYTVSGTRAVRFLGFLPLTLSVAARVDAQTGRVVSVSEPWFLSKLGFLFTN